MQFDVNHSSPLTTDNSELPQISKQFNYFANIASIHTKWKADVTSINKDANVAHDALDCALCTYT